MYSVTVCDHILTAHSFHGEVFGRAARLHGITLVVEAEFRAAELDELQLLIDIGLAKTELRRVLDPLDYSNLDDNPAFAGKNTTIEFLAHHLHGLLALSCREGRLGAGGQRLSGLKIVLRESPVAWAAFEGPVL
jgi:6-pyruvoyl-tetrahydropterin synthase